MKSVVKKVGDHYFGDIFAFSAKILTKYPATSFYEKALYRTVAALVLIKVIYERNFSHLLDDFINLHALFFRFLQKR